MPSGGVELSAPFRFPRFFVTTPSPCPYIKGKTERKVFTELSGAHAGELNDALGRIGFRRSQNVAYRPSCLDCSACISVRVVAQEFRPNTTQRRVLKRNADLEVTACKAWATEAAVKSVRERMAWMRRSMVFPLFISATNNACMRPLTRTRAKASQEGYTMLPCSNMRRSHPGGGRDP